MRTGGPPTEVAELQNVRATGTPQEFDITAFEQQQGVDLDDELYSEYQDRPVLVAGRVETMRGERGRRRWGCSCPARPGRPGRLGREGARTIHRDTRHPMGTTTHHPRPRRLPLPSVLSMLPLTPNRYPNPLRPRAYPPSANKPRFSTMVRVTLKTTLTTIQNKHPGPTRRKGNRLPVA